MLSVYPSFSKELQLDREHRPSSTGFRWSEDYIMLVALTVSPLGLQKASWLLGQVGGTLKTEYDFGNLGRRLGEEACQLRASVCKGSEAPGHTEGRSLTQSGSGREEKQAVPITRGPSSPGKDRWLV